VAAMLALFGLGLLSPRRFESTRGYGPSFFCSSAIAIFVVNSIAERSEKRCCSSGTLSGASDAYHYVGADGLGLIAVRA